MQTPPFDVSFSEHILNESEVAKLDFVSAVRELAADFGTVVEHT